MGQKAVTSPDAVTFDNIDEWERARRLAEAIRHELRQPLFIIGMANESLRLMLEQPDIPQQQLVATTERIAEQVQRLQAMITRPLEREQPVTDVAGSADLVIALRNALRFMSGLFEMTGVTVDLQDLPARAPVPLGGIEIEQVFINVLRNAVDSIQSRHNQGWQGQGRIVISVESTDGALRCVVSDNGAGLARQMPPAAFRPFHTTKPLSGTGLGLYICEAMITAVGGAIRLRPGEPEGAAFEMRLPLAGALNPPHTAAEGSGRSGAGGGSGGGGSTRSPGSSSGLKRGCGIRYPGGRGA